MNYMKVLWYSMMLDMHQAVEKASDKVNTRSAAKAVKYKAKLEEVISSVKKR